MNILAIQGYLKASKSLELMKIIKHLTRQIHTDKFPQRSFVANATILTLLQFAGDLRHYVFKNLGS